MPRVARSPERSRSRVTNVGPARRKYAAAAWQLQQLKAKSCFPLELQAKANKPSHYRAESSDQIGADRKGERLLARCRQLAAHLHLVRWLGFSTGSSNEKK